MYNEKEYQKIYREKHKEQYKIYRQKHNGKRKEQSEIWREKNKEYYKNYYQNNKDKINKYREKNKNKIKEYKKEWIKRNKNKVRELHKQWAIKNRKKMNLYQKNKREYDINYKIVCNLRSRLVKALKNNSKTKTTLKLVGCGIEFLREHLQKQFKQGMNWQNYGLWHIDHIRPCSKFDLSKPNEQAKCFNYSNLQPLWAKENLEKSNKNYRDRKIYGIIIVETKREGVKK